MNISGKELHSLIPQAEPMIMISNLLSSDEKTTSTSLKISEDNILVEDNYFSEYGIIENMAQTAAARAGYYAKQNNEAVKVGFIGAIKKLKISFKPKVNDEIYTTITSDFEMENISVISAKTMCNNETVATCEMKIFLMETEK